MIGGCKAAVVTVVGASDMQQETVDETMDGPLVVVEVGLPSNS